MYRTYLIVRSTSNNDYDGRVSIIIMNQWTIKAFMYLHRATARFVVHVDGGAYFWFRLEFELFQNRTFIVSFKLIWSIETDLPSGIQFSYHHLPVCDLRSRANWSSTWLRSEAFWFRFWHFRLPVCNLRSPKSQSWALRSTEVWPSGSAWENS